MNIEEFSYACEGIGNGTEIFYHATAFVPDYIKPGAIMRPTSLDIGNAMQKPGVSIFMWKTIEEAKTWLGGLILTNLADYCSMIKEHKGFNFESIYSSIFAKDDLLIKESKSFDVSNWWDRLKRKWIIPENEKSKFDTIAQYCDRHEIYGYVLKIETRKKYVSIGQTATLKEYTTRDPQSIIRDVIKVRINKAYLNSAFQIVPDAYFKENDAICDASLMNRGLKSFFNINEYDKNIRFNEDMYNIRDAFYSGEMKNDDVNKYIKDNHMHLDKMYPIERISRTIRGKRYLKRKYGVS